MTGERGTGVRIVAMRAAVRIGTVLGAGSMLAACGGEREESELTADEEQQLNEAAAMLDEPEDGGGEAEENGSDVEAEE